MEELTLRFRIINAGVAVHEVEIEHEGQPATVRQHRLYVDAEPLDGTEKTLELTLPAGMADQFPEGGIITAVLSVEAPLELEQPAEAPASAPSETPVTAAEEA